MIYFGFLRHSAGGFEQYDNHIAHARRALIEASKEIPVPKSRTVMWY